MSKTIGINTAKENRTASEMKDCASEMLSDYIKNRKNRTVRSSRTDSFSILKSFLSVNLCFYITA